MELIFGRCRKFRNLMETVDRYAQTLWPVLVTGETGVGKELIARRLHSRSPFSRSRFIPVNCGAIPSALVESELFGYERGAFSGATQSQKGLIRQAKGGTLFLDEIGDLELSAQVKLLRFLDTGEIRAVGSVVPENVEVRVIAATHHDLGKRVERGLFRQDLWERLSVLPLHIPPLRERPQDIRAIALHWASEQNCQISEDALSNLEPYPWPGNVRQLKNVLARAFVRGEGRIEGPLISLLLEEERLRQGPQYAKQKNTLEKLEKEIIVDRIKQCNGNRKQAAKELGIAKSTLHDKLRRWKVQDPLSVPNHLGQLRNEPPRAHALVF